MQERICSLNWNSDSMGCFKLHTMIASSLTKKNCLSQFFFYHLTKIHKHLIKPPGQLIRSAINCLIGNLSFFRHLSPRVLDMKNYPITHNYLEDSDDVIWNLMGIKWRDNLSPLTMDVTVPYTIVGQETEVDCIINIWKKNQIYPLSRDPY